MTKSKTKLVQLDRALKMPLPEAQLPPLPNYTLSTICPACNTLTVRRACKVHCERCGFVWDCSEL